MWTLLLGAALAGEPPGPPPFRMIRYQEDYRFLQDAERRGWQRWKYVPLGAQLRARTEFIVAPDLGFAGVDDQDVLFGRALLHADLHSPGDWGRLFVQLGSAFALDSELPVRSIDADQLGVRQAFGDLVVRGEDWSLCFRGGRQELTFGSSRLYGLREGPNLRLVHDGLRIRLQHDRTTADLFAVATVIHQPGVFDDLPSTRDVSWGGYTSSRLLDTRVQLDAYYLGLRRPQARFQTAVGVELRHSLGARLFGRVGAYDYNLEVIGQVGSFDTQRIAAWTVASDQGGTHRWSDGSFRAGVKADITSGDASRGDDVLNTFNPIHPNNAYFSQLVVLTPANHIDVHPYVQLGLVDRFRMDAGVVVFWRASLQDDLYGPPVVPIVDLTGRDERFTGVQSSASVTADLTDYASLTVYGSHFAAGDVVQAAQGRSSSFLGVWFGYVL